jgi:hypothetical protein
LARFESGNDFLRKQKAKPNENWKLRAKQRVTWMGNVDL